MIQEIFGGRLIDQPNVGFLDFDDSQKAAAAAVAAGFVGLISLFNIGGRFFWASVSDKIGRKMMYAVITALGAIIYALIAPVTATGGALLAFAMAFGVIASMYGGGFATIPAYLADIFGTQFVGAIHGRLLTAWSTAGVLGVLVVNIIHDRDLKAGAVGAASYTTIYFWLAGLLAVAFVANLLVKPVAAKWHMTQESLDALRPAGAVAEGSSGGIDRGRFDLQTALVWAVVVLPMAWGIWITLNKAAALFR